MQYLLSICYFISLLTIFHFFLVPIICRYLVSSLALWDCLYPISLFCLFIDLTDVKILSQWGFRWVLFGLWRDKYSFLSKFQVYCVCMHVTFQIAVYFLWKLNQFFFFFSLFNIESQIPIIDDLIEFKIIPDRYIFRSLFSN